MKHSLFNGACSEPAGLANCPSTHVQPNLPSRVPLDGRFVGWGHLVFGIGLCVTGVLLLTGLVQPVRGEWRVLGPFGVFELQTTPWQAGYAVFSSMLLAAGGWGLAKGRGYGWWLLAVAHIDRLPTVLVNLPVRPALATAYLAFSLVALVWLTWRRRVFRPFGKWHPSCRGTG